MRLPIDCDELEVELYEYLAGGRSHTAHVYSKIVDPIDKFIIAYVFEMGHTRKEAEIALGLSKATIWKRIKRIRVELNLSY